MSVANFAMQVVRPVVIILIGILIPQFVQGQHSVKLVNNPCVSPDGKKVAFDYSGDLWEVEIGGGKARQLTVSPANDSRPKYSPDGKTIAFNSSREGRIQIFTMPVEGGLPTQITFHSEGSTIREWSADGKHLLIEASRDHYWGRNAGRIFLIEAKPRPFERLLFDAYGDEATLSPEGNRVLFTRESISWYRKGYHGSQAGQVWMYDRERKTFEKVAHHQNGCRMPMWGSDGKSIIFVSQEGGSFNLWKKSLSDGSQNPLTDFNDDSVVMPSISRDGKTIVFRHLFDLYQLDLEKGGKPNKIEISIQSDQKPKDEVRGVLSSATEVAFTKDGLEIAMIAGGDLWVMDTELREPIRITRSANLESNPVFCDDGNSIVFISDQEGQSDIWKATRTDSKKYWWQNEEFKLERLTEDSDAESGLRLSPTGKHLSFVRGVGELWLMKTDGSGKKRLLNSWNAPSYDWSPDDKWIVYAQSDNDFNRDIYIMPVDQSREPFNVSMHPDNDDNPVWSPDGKVIAFTGRRLGDESDIYYVFLEAEQDETTARDRKLKKALDKMKARKKKSSSKSPSKSSPKSSPEKTASNKAKQGPEKKEEGKQEPKSNPGTPDSKKAPKEPKPVKIDFEGMIDRIRRVSIAGVSERGLFWSADSKQLAFRASIDGKSGVYSISPPTSTRPKFLFSTSGSSPRWNADNKIYWLVSGKPAVTNTKGGSTTSYSFSTRHQYLRSEKYLAAFELCWREMRDSFYDGNMNNKNWSEIRRKYADMARQAPDNATFAVVVNMMLGELNASHMGFFGGFGRRGRGAAASSASGWSETTAHFGLRFDPEFKGPGLKVRDVVFKSPAWERDSKILAGEVVLAIDGKEVDPAMELTQVLNGDPNRDVSLRVKNVKGEEREVSIRPTSYGAIRGMLYEHWVRQNQKAVAKASDSQFGYLHIQGMNMPSFRRFEQELYKIGHGKDGLVIDVRENGGGSTTDHLLTSLTQPTHAITVPRGGGRGYPHDRKIYASWNKPIVVLCNQNSFSNAEIFSHAIKYLKRGKVVGVPTAGGVISTGGTGIMDLGFIRKPFRAWYLKGDGEDMELNGCVPDHVLWPAPGEMPKGVDRQLDKAIEVLKQDVSSFQSKPKLELKPASQRPKK